MILTPMTMVSYVPAPSGLPLSARNDVAKMIVRWLCACALCCRCCGFLLGSWLRTSRLILNGKTSRFHVNLACRWEPISL